MEEAMGRSGCYSKPPYRHLADVLGDDFRRGLEVARCDGMALSGRIGRKGAILEGHGSFWTENRFHRNWFLAIHPVHGLILEYGCAFYRLKDWLRYPGRIQRRHCEKDCGYERKFADEVVKRCNERWEEYEG